MSFRRILIPTDFSTASEWVFDDAVRIAGAGGGELIILHVRMTWASHPTELRFPADPSLYDYAERQELDLLRERVRRANASVATRLIVRTAPDPATEIARTAEDEDVDLIVIATHARHHVAHMLVGSTTLSLVRQPPAPVLAIRYGTRKRKSMDRVVVPVHLGQGWRPALDLAVLEAREIHLITICLDEEQPQAQALVRDLAASINATDSIVLQSSDPKDEIIRYASRTDSDAIFLDAPHGDGEGEIDIIRHAPVPVMVVPGSKQ
jgi:nucleotide-binding universal stress UspA family protein